MSGRTATSLGRQLEKLKTPQTNQFEVKRGRESFLYEYSEAAGVDCDTHYSLAIEGLENLCLLDPSLEHFKTTLFDYSTKDWSRTNCTQENLEKMDQELQRFIWRGIAPYFLQSDCHKVLEWLIYKFRVHEALPDFLIIALCPYCETGLFPKLLQCMSKFKQKSHKWHFLYPNQKTGTPVSKNALITNAKTRSWFMEGINGAASSSTCQPVITNCTSLWIGVLSDYNCEPPTQDMILLGIDFCLKGFKSSSKDRIMSAIAVFSFIVTKNNLNETAVHDILRKSIRKIAKDESLLKECIKNYLFMLVVISRSQEISSLPPAVAKLVIKYLPTISDATNCEALSSLVVSSLDTGSESYFEDFSKLCGHLTKFPRKLVPAIEMSVKKKWSMTSDLEERAAIIAFLLKLQVSTGQNKISEIIGHHLTDASFFQELIEQLTVDENRRRPAFDPSDDNWKAVLLLLEHFHKPKKFIFASCVMTTCFQLLKESCLIETGSDYFKKSLINTIGNCMDQEDIEHSAFDTATLLDALKHLRHGGSQQECYKMLIKIMTSGRCSNPKDKIEMAKKLAASFTFFAGNLVKCDDKLSLEMLNESIDRLVPYLLSPSQKDGTSDSDARQSSQEMSALLDVFIDTLPDIPNHRRLDIFRRILNLANDPKWSALTIVKLVEANFGTGRPDNTGLNFSIDLIPHLDGDHHKLVLETMLDLVINKSKSLIVDIHGAELTMTDEFKLKLVRFMAAISLESSKLSKDVDVLNIVKSLSDSLPSLVMSAPDDETRKKIQDNLLSAIEKFMDGMALKDVLIASNDFLMMERKPLKVSSAGHVDLPLPRLALCCLNKHLRFLLAVEEDGQQFSDLDKDGVELVVKMCVHVSTGINEVTSKTSSEEDIVLKLTFIKHAAEFCARVDHRPKILKSLVNKCMKCYQNCSKTSDGDVDTTVNIKLLVAAAGACRGLLRLFNDRKLMDTLLNIVVSNLSSENHLVRLSSTRILRNLVTDPQSLPLLIEPEVRNPILVKVHESNMDEAMNKSVVRQFNENREEIIRALTAIKQENQ